MKQIIPAILLLLTSLCVYSQNANEEVYAEALISSNHLIPGESVNVVVRIHGGRADNRPATPVIPDTALNFIGTQTQVMNFRQLISVFKYRLTPAKVGSYTIPPFVVSSGGRILETEALTFQVHDPATLQKVSSGIKGVDLLAAWLPTKSTLYPGEPTPVTLKLYAPQILNVVNWGMLEPVKENSLVWRFSSTDSTTSTAIIDGERYVTESLSSTLSGIAPGTASLKESNLEITIRQSVADSRFGRRINDYALNITIPDLNIDIIPFPKGAPDGFNGAVGNFQIASHSEKPSFNASESTEVILQIGGVGNVESLKAPVIGESATSGLDWKVVNTSKETRGKERRELSGVVTFRENLRPLIDNNDVLNQPNIAIPSYSFSFFNPATKEYKTLTTDPIPVEITPAPYQPMPEDELSSSEKAEVIPEKMTEILSIVQSPNNDNVLSLNENKRFPLWNIAPAIIFLFIITLPIQRYVKKRFTKSPEKKAKANDFKKLSTQSQSTEFFADAGRYISRWIPDTANPELQSIIQERDEICFQSKTKTSESIKPERKNEILNLLKNLSVILITLCVFLSSETRAATPEKAYSEGKYQDAIDLYLQAYPSAANSIYDTPADVFYNLGNSYEKLNKSGEAALTWRRALAVDPTHEQARKNLRFVENEELAYAHTYQPWQTGLTQYSPNTYRFIYQLSIWLFLLSLLCLIFLKSKALVKNSLWLLITIISISPFTAAAGIIAYYVYPDTDLHIDYSEQAVVLSKASLYSQARRDESNYQVITPASLVKIIGIRGAWSHVQIIDDKRVGKPQQGWLKTDLITTIINK